MEGSADTTLTVQGTVLSIVAALVLGCIVSFTYAKTQRNAVASRNFMVTLIILPAVISVIIMLVGSNVARAFSLAGAFSLVRFRSAPGDPKDIAFVCLVMSLGLATGMGYLTYALLACVLLCAALFLIALFASRSKREWRTLKITIPEDLNYKGAFDDILGEHTSRHTLNKVRTTDLGSLFQLVYTVELKDEKREKQFMDDLRCRNGNLDIELLLTAQE